MSEVTDRVKVENIVKPADAGVMGFLPGLMGGGGLGSGGLGAGVLGGILGGALLGGGRRGLFGGADCGDGGGAETRIEDTIFNTQVLAKLGNIEGAIPAATARTENVILQQTNALGSVIGNLALSLNSTLSGINQNVSEQGCKTRETVQASTTAILSKIDANTIAALQAELAEARHTGRARETEVNVTQTVTQAQAQTQLQAQQQQQLGVLQQLLVGINHLTQVAHATNTNVIAGNAGAVTTGPQTANPVNVAA